jgi:hypothetical protein
MLSEKMKSKQIESNAELSQRMEPLLMPSNGPTEADEAQLEEASDEDDDDDDDEMFWDEDDDEDDFP